MITALSIALLVLTLAPLALAVYLLVSAARSLWRGTPD